MGIVEQLSGVAKSERASALEAWWAEQTDGAAAARALAQELEALSEDDLVRLLDAEGLRHPLDDAAEAADDAKVASKLWCHASTSAMVTLDLADLPYLYARNAVLADPENEAAWGQLQDSLHSDNTGLFEDLPTFAERVRDGEIAASILTRAIAAGRAVAPDWNDDDRAFFEELLAEIDAG